MPEVEESHELDALGSLLFSSGALAARRVAPKSAAPVMAVRKPVKAAPKKVAPKKAAPAKKVAPKKAAPAKKVAPKKAASARKPGKYAKAATGPPLGKKGPGVLFDVRELGGLTDPSANFLGLTNIDPQGLGYFDPWGFTIGASENKIRSYREAELKHGRLAMLAALGFVAGEITPFPLYDGELQDVASAFALSKWFDVAPQTTVLPVLALIFLESVSAVSTFRISEDPEKTFELTSDYTPGDVLSPIGVTFDPLGLAPKDPDAFREMQTKELNNGRVAMIASIIFFYQEATTGNPLFAA
jgi:light-harvesting complex I chlorophyll a/b binding protein 1